MSNRGKINIFGLHSVPIAEIPYRKFLRKYYKGINNLTIRFDNRIKGWGEHYYDSETKTHHITISPKWCSHEYQLTRDFTKKLCKGKLQKLESIDIIASILQTTLHELKHAEQCDRNPIRYTKCTDDEHPEIENNTLKYKFSLLESEAEGWSLMHIYKGLEQYEDWCYDR